MRILALDPGKFNFGTALLIDGKIEHVESIDTLHDITQCVIINNTEIFNRAIKNLLISAQLNPKCDLLVIERFMHRARNEKGSVGELVNIMIGLTINIAKIHFDINSYLITPAQWKNYAHSNWGMKNTMIKLIKSTYNRKDNFFTEHEYDAVGMACYFYEKETGIPCFTKCLCDLMEIKNGK